MKKPPLRAVLVFVAIALVSGALVCLLTLDRIPELTEARLDAAAATWAKQPLASYDLRLEMEGSELAKGAYLVEVRPGAAPHVLRDGVATTGDPAVFTVEGLLRTVREEIGLAATPERTFGAPPGYRAYLYAKFDARGVPVRYRRVVGGANKWSEWRVLSVEQK